MLVQLGTNAFVVRRETRPSHRRQAQRRDQVHYSEYYPELGLS